MCWCNFGIYQLQSKYLENIASSLEYGFTKRKVVQKELVKSQFASSFSIHFYLLFMFIGSDCERCVILRVLSRPLKSGSCSIDYLMQYESHIERDQYFPGKITAGRLSQEPKLQEMYH